MIRLSKIEVRGTTEKHRFGGSFDLDLGLQVIVADNHFGKSLAVVSIAWCLGLEPMFGLKDNDPSRFPLAVREVIDLKGERDIPVLSSEAILTIERDDGSSISIQREILGDPSTVNILECTPDGSKKSIKLNTRKHTMKDSVGGLQNYLFSWINIPRQSVVTRDGSASEIYLENIAPLFLIDQSEGWSDLQALQVYRYRQLDIHQVAVEYILGANAALESRVNAQTEQARESAHKHKAEMISEKVGLFFKRHGWDYNLSTHGSTTAISTRWAMKPLQKIIEDQFGYNFAIAKKEIHTRSEILKKHLIATPSNSNLSFAASEASQKVIELKSRRHALREELRIARTQKQEQESLADNLHQRIRSAQDVLRYKESGIGRLEEIECPSCHRHVDPESFGLNQHSLETIKTHISALQRDEQLVRSNLQHVQAITIRLAVEIDGLDEEYRNANRVLTSVNSASGEEREFLAKVATELAGLEREEEKISASFEEVQALQNEITNWVQQNNQQQNTIQNKGDLVLRISKFEEFLQNELLALGHTAIPKTKDGKVYLDEDYIPHLGPRRVRSLGSASDHPRLVSAYALSLAASSPTIKGNHPGFVVLDEPLQQNPDDKHKNLFFKYLETAYKTANSSQVLIFTWIKEKEVTRLRKSGVNVKTPTGEHFLQIIAPAEAIQTTP